MADNSNEYCSPEHEQRRLEILAEYRVLDTPKESAFDDIVELASLICEAPIAVINFIDRDRQWFKSEKGLGVRETPLDISICASAIRERGLFIVPDTTRDPRFAHNPMVTGQPHLHFYAGAILEGRDGCPLGTLCVLDYQPRQLTEHQQFALQALANQVMTHLELMLVHREQAELIRELERTKQELTLHAATDPLTGLLNRRALEQRFNQEAALIQRGSPPAALLLIDLDHFKRVNDNFGHQAGDGVIVRFAELCRKVFREIDVIGRWGGEEFVIMLPRTSVVQAEQAAERLRQLWAATSMQHEAASPLYITASIGVCSLTATSTMDECLHKADALLYQAKEQGRNRIVSET